LGHRENKDEENVTLYSSILFLQIIPCLKMMLRMKVNRGVEETTYITHTRGKNPNELRIQLKDHASGYSQTGFTCGCGPR
jgi:hypothetical protein